MGSFFVGAGVALGIIAIPVVWAVLKVRKAFGSQGKTGMGDL